jgi:transcription antitermination factor NusG
LWQGDRPEVLFPFEGGEPEKSLPFRVELAVGQRVRILAGPAVGRTGKIVTLGEETEFESGLRYPMTTVQLREGDRLTVPQQNLAVLG